jgi:metal-responsive CopG/Arc/MetJ family transcriptional regulator
VVKTWKKNEVIHVRLQRDVLDQLHALIRERPGATRSDIIRTALLLYFESIRPAPPAALEQSPSGEDLLRSLNAHR